MRVYNFSAGPAMIPDEVMQIAQSEFTDYKSSGSGIMELSHRGALFTEVIKRAESNIRELMNISDDYAICFVQGGAWMQFGMVPMNLLNGGSADYVDTGVWASAAIKEAARYGTVNVIASSKETKYDRIPEIRHWKPTEGAKYLHITSNNTIYGTQYHEFPPVVKGVPMVSDMSSDIMSRVINVNDFGLIYAGLQKNLGPSGMAMVIVRKDLVKDEELPKWVPSMLRYNTYIEKENLFNTPPTFAIYMLALVTDWLKKQGGLKVVENINNTKSEAIYEILNQSSFYTSPVQPSARSRMNVVFRLPTEELEAKFVKESNAAGMTGLKGHRSAGGIRASIYNAVPLKGVEKLVDFMIDFEKKNS
jgi:phosphoserine aminotransferase